jgi:hypothetical protein
MPWKDTLIRLYEDSRSPGICRGCDAQIEWFETLRGAKMPMNAGAVPRKSENEAGTRRVIAYFAAEDSHFGSCPAAAQFSHKARR